MNFFRSKPITLPKHNCVQENALQIPAVKKLVGKRVILASNSPRRKEILKTYGIIPEIVPSIFDEDLPHSSFENVHEYPVATATHKAVEVYERLVRDDPDDAPDLVIAADTVVLTHPTASVISQFADQDKGPQEILEKPSTQEDNYRMLLDLNGGICEVVTGVTLVYPVLEAPGYKIKSLDERTLVHFADNPETVLRAYVEGGEGIDRAGGFAIQGQGGILIRKVDGDYNNVVGFPAASFFKFLDLLLEEETDFLAMD
ncbi:Maf/Ham1 [Cristinia sonorae]|uniref:Maf/Ham1 n=1 Tax=Cristinia sonorae TaxID=1940300 RepID=A0A8K0UJ98_9AGAR|nr:Maf/Ham1 [Cristinia sonorae]